MKQLRKRLTYANVMSSIAVFLVLGGATAIAAGLAKNSVGTKQLKKNAVTAAKIKKNAVTTAKIQNGAVTGEKINAGTLGTVPRATHANTATTADSAKSANTAKSAGTAGSAETASTANTANSANALAGQTTFAVRLGFGQSQVVATNGPVSFVANCKQEGPSDWAEVLYQTTANGSVANGEDDFDGSSPTEFLNTDTPAGDRVLVNESAATGKTFVGGEIDNGFVLGPDGKGLVANTEGVILGINYGGAGCYIAGVVNAVG